MKNGIVSLSSVEGNFFNQLSVVGLIIWYVQ